MMTAEIPEGFIDIHSHILPGLDDGPTDMDQCIELARRYLEIGMHCVVATPHWFRFTGWASSPEKVKRTAAQVEQALHKAGVPLTILPGMEIGFTEPLSRDIIDNETLPIGASGYRLMEFPLAAKLVMPERFILHLGDRDEKVRVILAHPERCPSFRNNTDSVRAMAARGVLVQLNFSSLVGRFGSPAQETAVQLLRAGLVHFLATDSHAVGKRVPPDMLELTRLKELIGPEAVAAACADNPRRLLMGQKVVPLAVDPERLDKYFSGYYSNMAKETGSESSPEGFFGKLRNLFRE